MTEWLERAFDITQPFPRPRSGPRFNRGPDHARSFDLTPQDVVETLRAAIDTVNDNQEADHDR